MEAAREMDSDILEDLERLEKALDEVILRSPISPDKASEYYRLSFCGDQVCTKQTTLDKISAGNESNSDLSVVAKGNSTRSDAFLNSLHQDISLNNSFRNEAEFTESESKGLESSPVTNASPGNTGIVVNKILAQEQLAVLNKDQTTTVNQQPALSYDINSCTLNPTHLCFTGKRIEPTRPKSLAIVQQRTACLPLNTEKVIAVTAGEGSNHIDIPSRTVPYADDQDESNAVLGTEFSDNNLSNAAEHCTEEYNDSAMYRYGYTSGSDSGYRRYSGGLNSSSGYRSPTLSHRSSFSRPTMVSSISPISYSSRPRDTSYTSSSLRRSTSLGNDRPYYRGTSLDYSIGSRLPFDYHSPRVGHSSPSTQRRFTVSDKMSDNHSDETDGDRREDQTSNRAETNLDRNLSGTERQTDGENESERTSSTPSRYSVTLKDPVVTVSESVISQNKMNTDNSEKTKAGAGNERGSSGFYVNVSYDQHPPLNRGAEKRTAVSLVMSPSKDKNKSSTPLNFVNLSEDGPTDRTKVVGQVTSNTSPPEQNRYTHNRQIWSRPDDSTNLCSEIYSDSETGKPREILDSRQSVTLGKSNENSQYIDHKASGEVDEIRADKRLTSENNQTYRSSYRYCIPSPSVTAQPRNLAMGANVQSTHSSASVDEGSCTEMEGRNRSTECGDQQRDRHRSEEEDYVLTESTSSFIFRNGQWVPENTQPENVTEKRSVTGSSSSTSAPLPAPRRADSNFSTDQNDRGQESRQASHRSVSLSSAGSLSPSKYESASSMPDSPGISSTQHQTRGDNSVRHGESTSGRFNDNRSTSARQTDQTAMDLYRERMNIISGFDKGTDNSDRGQQKVVTEKLHIPFSPPTFTVQSTGDSTVDREYGSFAGDSASKQPLRHDRNTSGEGAWGYYAGCSSHNNRATNFETKSFHRGTKEAAAGDVPMASAAPPSCQTTSTAYYVTEPPEEEINRNDVLSGESLVHDEDVEAKTEFVEAVQHRKGSLEVTEIQDMGAHITGLSSDGNRTRAEQGLFQASQVTEQSRHDQGSSNTHELPPGVGTAKGSTDSTSRFYRHGNVNTENDTTSTTRPGEVNKPSSRLPKKDANEPNHNQVTIDGSDVIGFPQDTSCVGEKRTFSANERIDTASTTQCSELATQPLGNISARESLAQDDDLLDRNRDTRGFSALESMSNNQISERRGGIYYSGNISRRNVTGILADDNEDRRRALALSQTETQRIGEMVQTSDTPGNRSELRQLHAGQTSTRKAAGVEVSKDGDRSRSRDVTDTIDRSRTDTEYKSETPSGQVQVTKVREDRQSHTHEDRNVQAEIKKDGREVRQSSSSKSESAQVSRVTESGDSRVSQRQERHFKSSRVTRSSRTSGGSYSGDNTFRKAVGFGSDDSDGEWSSSIRNRDSRDGSAISSGNQVDKFNRRLSDSDEDSDSDTEDPYRETIVHENKAAELLKNSMTRTDREGTISLEEQRQRGILDRGVTRNISEDGSIRTQRVQQRTQLQTATRTASSTSSRTGGSFKRDSTVSAEDEAVILAALSGRLEEKEFQPFTPGNYLTSSTMGSEEGTVAIVRNTEDVEGEENMMSPEEQSRAIARAKLEYQARQANARRTVARKRTIIVDEEMMEELFLRCIICRERYNTEERTPKLLPCHHTFCMECLREMFRVESEHRQTLTTAYRDAAPSFVTIHCPTCRASHMITDKEFTSYKSDHKVLELLEISQSPNKDNVGYCKTHRTQVTDHFCETCLHTVCSDCKVLDHREQDGHVVYSTEEALRLYGNQARVTIRDMESEDRKLARTEEKLKSALDVINNKLTNSEQLIRQTFDKFKVAINNRQDQLLDKIESEMGGRRGEFSGELGEITKRMETIEKTQTTTKQAQEDEDVEQMFTAHQNAREMFKNSFDVTKNQKPNIKAAFFYEKRDRANIMNTVSDHGMMTFQS